MLDKVLSLVRKTKEIILDLELKNNVKEKGYGNYVTQVDISVQKFLRESLMRLYPAIQFMGEEGEQTSIDFKKPVWILDPIDGTANLIRGLRQSAVSIALAENGVPVLGAVYNPFSDELFYAEKGNGAYLNGDRIHVSDAETLRDSLISIGTAPYDKQLARETFDAVYEIYCGCQDIRRFGAAAIELCNLAAGRLDGFFEMNLKPWDYAAGAIILQEAGGEINNYEGNPVALAHPDNIISSNGKIHSELFHILQRTSEKQRKEQ